MVTQPYTPDYLILADNQNITDTIRRHLILLRATDERGMQSDTLELHLNDRDKAIALPRRGAKLKVSIGYKETDLALMGVYIIDEVTIFGPPNSMTIKGKAVDMHGLLKSQKTRAWDNLTLGDLIAHIAGEYSLSPRIDDALAAIKINHLDQTDESDLHLLSRLRREYDATFTVKNRCLIFIRRAQSKSASGSQLPAVSLAGIDLSRWHVRLADRTDYNSVTAYYHDVQTALRMPVTIGTGAPAFSIQHNYPDRAAAEQAAAARFKKFARGKAALNISLAGNPALLAEMPLNISGARAGIDGNWISTRATHEISGAGYTTKIDAEVPK